MDTNLGHERRQDKSQTHGGMSIDEFIQEAMEAIINNTYEALIGHAKHIKANTEEMFEAMNKRFSA